MKQNHLSGILVRTALTLTLISCSDSTQFSEKTVGQGADATQQTGQENPDGTDPTNVQITVPEDGTTNGGDPSNQDPNATDPNGSEDPNGTDPDPTAGTGGGGGSTNPGTQDPADPDAPIFASCLDQPNSPIIAKVYELPVNTSKLPNFANMSSVDDVCISQLNIADRDFDQGFPGVQDLIEWFGLDITFRVNVPASGNYTFTVNSDDGSKLYIDNALIIDNDGQHAQQEKSASVNLTQGVHNFHIKYFQGPRYKIALELFWKMPGQQQRSYIPTQYLSRPE